MKASESKMVTEALTRPDLISDECETASLAASFEAWSKESLVRSCWRQREDVYMSEKLYEAKQVPRENTNALQSDTSKHLYCLRQCKCNYSCAGKSEARSTVAILLRSPPVPSQTTLRWMSSMSPSTLVKMIVRLLTSRALASGTRAERKKVSDSPAIDRHCLVQSRVLLKCGRSLDPEEVSAERRAALVSRQQTLWWGCAAFLLVPWCQFSIVKLLRTLVERLIQRRKPVPWRVSLQTLPWLGLRRNRKFPNLKGCLSEQLRFQSATRAMWHRI